MVHGRLKNLFRRGNKKTDQELSGEHTQNTSRPNNNFNTRRRSSPSSNSIPNSAREEEEAEDQHQNEATGGRRPTIRTESEHTSSAEFSGRTEQDNNNNKSQEMATDLKARFSSSSVNRKNPAASALSSSSAGEGQPTPTKRASNVSEADTARTSNVSVADRATASPCREMNGDADKNGGGPSLSRDAAGGGGGAAASASSPATAGADQDKQAIPASASKSGGALRRSSPVPTPTEFSRYRSTGHRPLTMSKKEKVGAGGGEGGGKDQIFDDPKIVKSYDSIPLLEITQLPRGGISLETDAVGRVQFGIPPETIKDGMSLGLGVPSVYVVPVERFCREMGPALGVNLAEFEFPAYFNFFVLQKKCTLIVDSDDAERNIRRVFSETLLGPAQFRREKDSRTFEEEDFSPNFPREAIPNMQKEFKHFRMMPDGKELVLETLLKFCHFNMPGKSGVHEGLGVPPPLKEEDVVNKPAKPEVRSRAASLKMPRRTKSTVSSPDLPALAVDSDDEEGASSVNSTPQTPVLTKRFSDGVLESKDKRTSYLKTTDDLPAEAEQAWTSTNESDVPDLHQVAEEQSFDKKKSWAYSQAKWIGDVATVYPDGTTPEQMAARSTKRVELFKMPGGTEYILHDIDEKNFIVGKARFSGNVRVSESMSVDGFGGKSFMKELAVSRRKSDQLSDSEDEVDPDSEEKRIGIPRTVLPPTFHPPSFGVTVLGNSHGFDKTGSVSGYVLWINGRGVMIDPPPYSSATLEREGIRPRTIVGIILTHCHADHDAGAFQKVLTGSPVVVITTPTIYKSFIRKYAALSALSPALLRHSHRHKPAIIGQPLRFQGATFHFTYTLHTIPCVGFRVEWRGRSMVFTGDHFNSPPAIDKLQETGVLSKGRADDLRNLPLQETDLLLHEAGAPPIHTPLDVLMALPEKVKKRLYVVHTSALPEGCELRVAPTGTAGTIRLDQLKSTPGGGEKKLSAMKRSSILESMTIDEDSVMQNLWSATSEYDSSIFDEGVVGSSIVSADTGVRGAMPRMNSLYKIPRSEPPLVSLRPTSSTDAWFILNLLSAVPFLSSLSYASTMEVLETARVDAFCINDIVVPATRRRDVLCVVWEGTCMERERTAKALVSNDRSRAQEQKISSGRRRVSTFELNQGAHTPLTAKDVKNRKRTGAVWHAGDWTGPRSLQPEKRLSGESSLSGTHDIVAMSSEGVKVITVEFSNLHAILKSGSTLYCKYLARRAKQNNAGKIPPAVGEGDVSNEMFQTAARNLNIIELLECNSALRKLSAVQKRHLESLAEGPVFYNAGQRLWRAGAPVDKAFLLVAGTAAFVPRRRNAGSVAVMDSVRDFSRNDPVDEEDEYEYSTSEGQGTSIGEEMRLDAIKAIQELGPKLNKNDDTGSGGSSITSADGSLMKDDEDHQFGQEYGGGGGGEHNADAEHAPHHEVARLSRGLQKRADSMSYPNEEKDRRDSHSSTTEMSHMSHEVSLHDLCEGEDEHDSMHESEHMADVVPGDGPGAGETSDSRQLNAAKLRRRSSRDRFANKVLGRLYNRRAFTAGLVFSKGHFLGDVSKMVATLLSNAYDETARSDDASEKYGFGEKNEGKADMKSTGAPIGELVIHEKEGDQHVVHSSTLAAGKDGCVVLVFPQASLIPFMDEYPGLLLSLLGTQVVV